MLLPLFLKSIAEWSTESTFKVFGEIIVLNFICQSLDTFIFLKKSLKLFTPLFATKKKLAQSAICPLLTLL